MVLRPLRRGDLESLVVLCAAHAEYEGAPYDSAGKAEALRALLFGGSPSLFGWGVEQPGCGLIGFATWSVQISTWDAARYAHMDCLYLNPEARNRGLGRNLMARLAQDALAAGCGQMQWQTPVSNDGAIRFYERLGAAIKPKARFYLERSALHHLTTDLPARHA